MSSILPLDKQFTNALYPFDIDRGSIYHQTWFNTLFCFSHLCIEIWFTVEEDDGLQNTLESQPGTSKGKQQKTVKRKAEKMASKKSKIKKMERENVKMYNQLLKVILPKAHKLFGSSSSSDSD